MERPAEFVQSLERGLSVLKAFSAQTPQLTLSEVARRTNMTRATSRRFLITLESLGYVASDGRHFHLLPKTLELGYAYLSSFTVSEIAQEHLGRLAESLHESCSASVLDDTDIIYIARASTNRIMTIGLSVGARLPAYCTSMGRVLLAAMSDDELIRYFERATLVSRTDNTLFMESDLRRALSQVTHDGWCLQDQELEDGVRSVAAPLHDIDGRVIAAINISAHATRVSLDELKESFVPQLLECAAVIDADLRSRR